MFHFAPNAKKGRRGALAHVRFERTDVAAVITSPSTEPTEPSMRRHLLARLGARTIRKVVISTVVRLPHDFFRVTALLCHPDVTFIKIDKI